MDLLYQRLRGKYDSNLVQNLEKELMIRALKETNGNQVKTSALLGITRTTLRKRIETYGLGES
jgi:DNA-binding protein Fis